MKPELAARVFAAETRGKRPTSEIGEDELTSRFLGIMSHLTTATQADVLGRLGLVGDGGPPDSIEIALWPRIENDQESREFDAIVACGTRRIAFEFKWQSEGYAEQIAAEWRLLDPASDVLVYVTRANIRPPEVIAAELELGVQAGTIRWIPWSRILRASREVAASCGDDPSRLLLLDFINLLEVVGVSEWDEYLNEYWRVVGDDKVSKAYTGLAQYFKNLRSHLVAAHAATHKVGDPTTSFADKSYVEFTPREVTSFDSTLGIFVVFEHRKREWYVSLEGKVTYDPAIRAWKVLEEAGLANVEVGDPKENGYTAAWHTFQPTAGFSNPEGLTKEIERELLSFSKEIAGALMRGHRT